MKFPWSEVFNRAKHCYSFLCAVLGLFPAIKFALLGGRSNKTFESKCGFPIHRAFALALRYTMLMVRINDSLPSSRGPIDLRATAAVHLYGHHMRIIAIAEFPVSSF